MLIAEENSAFGRHILKPSVEQGEVHVFQAGFAVL